MFDVAIVGGGPAGLSTALHLPRGVRCVVLEKERYPREKICAGGIGARALRLLARIGVEVDCPMVPLHALALRFGAEESVIRHPGMGFVVRRVEFDHALARAAIARDIDVRDGCGVDDLEVLADRVRLHTTQGPIEARVLVGADGVAGIVRRKTGFPRGELRAQVCELDTPATARDQPRDTIVFDFATTELRGYAWDFPTQVAGVPLVCRGVYALGHDDKPKDRIARYLAARGLALADYKLKQFAERGWTPGERISKPRVLLVGEAAGIDIATGEGIGQAIEYGSIAGDYLARALERDDVGFADWQRTVARHHLGRQLRIRHGCYRAFYGRRRALLERLMPRMPALMQIGVQDFAGTPIGKLGLLRGAGQLLRALV